MPFAYKKLLRNSLCNIKFTKFIFYKKTQLDRIYKKNRSLKDCTSKVLIKIHFDLLIKLKKAYILPAMLLHFYSIFKPYEEHN